MTTTIVPGTGVSGTGTVSAAFGATYVVSLSGATVTATPSVSTLTTFTGADAGAVMQSIITELGLTGGTVVFDGRSNYTWSSVPKLPHSLTNPLIVNFNGAVINLTTAGPRLFDWNRTADHQVFKNIEIYYAKVDASALAALTAAQLVIGGVGRGHILIGSYINGAISSSQRINVQDFYMHDMEVVNVPTATTTTLTGNFIVGTDTVMNLTTTVGLRTSGQVTLSTANSITQCVMNYTGVSGNTLTGCTYSSGTSTTYVTGEYVVDTGLSQHHPIVYMITQHLGNSEATQSVIQRVRFERIKAIGGAIGIVVAGQNAAGANGPTNILCDRITIRDCHHDCNVVPRAFYSSSNYQIGSHAQVGTCLLDNCYGANSADVGIEFDSPELAKAVDCYFLDAYNVSFYLVNFQTPTNELQSQIIIDRCKATKQNCNKGSGIHVANNNSVPINQVVVNNFQWTKKDNTVNGLGQQDYAIVIPSTIIRRLIVDNCKVDVSGFTSPASGTTNMVLFYIRPATSTAVVRFRNIDVSIAGTKGAGTFTITAMAVSGLFDFTLDGYNYSENVTGIGALSSRALEFGSSIFGGGGVSTGSFDVRGMRWASVGVATSPRGVLIDSTADLTLNGMSFIRECDFSLMPTGGTETNFGTASQAAKVYRVDNKWKNGDTKPVPTTATWGATGTEYVNLSGYPETLYLYAGTVTVINWLPVTGGTAYQVGTTTPHKVRLGPGEAVTVTHSVAPTRRVVPVY